MSQGVCASLKERNMRELRALWKSERRIQGHFFAIERYNNNYYSLAKDEPGLAIL